MIAIVDYGVGNICAFSTVFKNLGFPFIIARKPEDLMCCDKLILPGVGAFDHAMLSLENSGMRQTLDDLVNKKKLPVLGICVGLQMLANYSEEGTRSGLGWLKGAVRHFDFNKLSKKDLPLPHMGWNSLCIHNPTNPLVKNIENQSRFYFLHSYYFDCDDPSNIVATSFYGVEFPSILNYDNVYGIQPHPEKSHKHGIALLRNFGEM